MILGFITVTFGPFVHGHICGFLFYWHGIWNIFKHEPEPSISRKCKFLGSHLMKQTESWGDALDCTNKLYHSNREPKYAHK